MKCVKSLSLLGLVLGSSLNSAAWAQSASPNAELERNVRALTQEVQILRKQQDNQAMLKLLQQVQALSEEIDQLRGSVELLTHENSNLKKRQRELYLDIDRRLHELEIRETTASQSVPQIEVPKLDPVAPSTTAQTTAPNPAKTPQPEPSSSPKPPAVVAVTPPKPLAVVAPVVKAPATTPKKPPATTTSEDRQAYQKAFDMLKEGRYQSAKSAFRGFISKHPKSPYASNAQYWLGEAHYVTRQFPVAVDEFTKVIKIYPSSNKVPDAMLKLGYTFYELKQYPQAREILAQLQKNYPRTTAARLAKQRIQRMNKEGL